MKDKILFTAAVLAAWLTFSQATSASLYLTPGGMGLGTAMTLAGARGQFDEGEETSQSDIDAIIAALLGNSDALYKSEVDGGTEEGPFSGSYTTTYDLEPDDPSYFKLEWDGGDFISGATHLLVKDGKADPAWYLFNISGLWDGMDEIIGFNFWPGQGAGAVSHVTIYRSEGVIPEPVSFAVWSLLIGSVGLVTARRRRAG